MKDEYMKILEEKLSKFNAETKREILEDYEAHFAEGRATGLSDDEIIRELGDIQEMIDEIPEEDIYKEEKENAQVAPFEKDSYENALYKTIVVETKAVDIMVAKSPDEKIHVDYQGPGNEAAQKNCRFYQYEKDSVFYVGVEENDFNYQSAGHFFSDLFKNGFRGNHHFSFGGGKINLEIPESVPNLEVRTLSGDICISNTVKVSADVKSTSGDIEICDCRISTLKTHSTSGDIRISDTNSEKAVLESSSGDQELTNSFLSFFTANSSSGDIDIKEVSGKEMSCHASSGDISISVKVDKADLKANSGDINADFCGVPVEINAQAGSGDVEITLAEAEAGQITAAAGSGDMVARIGANHYSGNNHSLRVNGNGSTTINVQTASGDSRIYSK